MTLPLRDVFVFGAGKVGTALHRGLRRAGVGVTKRAARRGWPRSPLAADLVVIAVRDDDVAAAAGALARAGIIGHLRRTVAVVHCAGALGPEALAAVRGARIGVAQMHPLISFASRSKPPCLDGGLLLVRGDPAARRASVQLGRKLGMRPLQSADVDLPLYHAAAALVANGSATLLEQGARLLQEAGIEAAEADVALGILLRTVAENVQQLGMPTALTGPVRRGAHRTVSAHLEALEHGPAAALRLYVAVAQAQLGLAAALGEASDGDLERIRRRLARSRPAAKKPR